MKKKSLHIFLLFLLPFCISLRLSAQDTASLVIRADTSLMNLRDSSAAMSIMKTDSLHNGKRHPAKTGRKARKETLELAMQDTASLAYLDSLDVKKNNVINDYTMIGVQYGMAMSQVMWNPSMRQGFLFIPYNFGITYTRYGKMFGYMPYFGFQASLIYAREGYKFKADDQSGYIPDVEGAHEAVMDVIEVPVMAHCHVDFWKMKLMVNIGFFAGYRLSIHRTGETVDPAIRDAFLDTDRRFDYGIKGGAGFGFVFDPVEIHFSAMYKYSMSSLYQPDYYSQYYYRYAYPSNIVFSVGLHFQLTKRTGKTRHQLKQEARQQMEVVNSLGTVGKQ